VAEGALPNTTGKEDVWSEPATSIEWVGVLLHTFPLFYHLTCHCISIKFVYVHAHTYATDITVFEENSSIMLSREKFNIWKLRQKLFWKNQKKKIWSVWKIFQIKNFKKLVRSASYMQC